MEEGVSTEQRNKYLSEVHACYRKCAYCGPSPDRYRTPLSVGLIFVVIGIIFIIVGVVYDVFDVKLVLGPICLITGFLITLITAAMIIEAILHYKRPHKVSPSDSISVYSRRSSDAHGSQASLARSAASLPLPIIRAAVKSSREASPAHSHHSPVSSHHASLTSLRHSSHASSQNGSKVSLHHMNTQEKIEVGFELAMVEAAKRTEGRSRNPSNTSVQSSKGGDEQTAKDAGEENLQPVPLPRRLRAREQQNEGQSDPDSDASDTHIKLPDASEAQENHSDDSWRSKRKAAYSELREGMFLRRESRERLKESSSRPKSSIAPRENLAIVKEKTFYETGDLHHNEPKDAW